MKVGFHPGMAAVDCMTGELVLCLFSVVAVRPRLCTCQLTNCCPLPDIPITDSHFWQSDDECTLETLRHVFRSTTDEEIPLLEERLACLKEAGKVLYEVSFTLPACFVFHKPCFCARCMSEHPPPPFAVAAPCTSCMRASISFVRPPQTDQRPP